MLADVTEHLGPGRSALVVLSSDGDPDAVTAAMKHGNATLVYAELDDDLAEDLEEIFRTETAEPTDDGD